jgi:HSP20 family protein
MTHVLVPRIKHRAVRPARTHYLGDFDRVFDDLWRGFGGTATPVATPATLAPRMDYHETETEIRVAAELPGLEEKDIQVSLEEGVLTIKGERAEETREENDEGFRHVETFRGSFHRALRLNANVDEDAVKAAYKNGILTVTLPKIPEAKPETRTIPVTTA